MGAGAHQLQRHQVVAVETRFSEWHGNTVDGFYDKDELIVSYITEDDPRVFRREIDPGRRTESLWRFVINGWND